MWPEIRTTCSHGFGTGLMPVRSPRAAPVARNPLLGLDLLRFGIRGGSHRYLLRRLVLTMMEILCFNNDVLMVSFLMMCEHVPSSLQADTTHAAATHDFFILHPLEPVLRIESFSDFMFSFLLFCSSRMIETILLVYICVCNVSFPAHGACSCLPSHFKEIRFPTSMFQLTILQGFLIYLLESPNCLSP